MKWIDTNCTEKRNVISMETLCRRVGKYKAKFPNAYLALNEKDQCLDLFDSNGNYLAQFLWEK